MSKAHQALATPVKKSRVVSSAVQAQLANPIEYIDNDGFEALERPEWLDADEGADSIAADLAEITHGGARMPAHLERLCAAPLLTPQLEQELFCRLNYVRFRAEKLRLAINAKRPAKARLSELQRLIDVADQVRNHIIHANVRLVISIVKQFADERNRFDDLLSEGISCLIKAVDKFDFDRGFRFSTYATRAVRREVFRLVQRQHRDRARYSTGTQELLSQELNRSLKPEGVDISWAALDDCIGRLFAALDDREKFIVGARYGFDDIGAKPTFQRLGQMLGVSKERVRQIEQRALGKLRQVSSSLRLEPVV